VGNCPVTPSTGLAVSRIESLAAELMMMIVIDGCYSTLSCSCRVLPLGPDYISIS
jgi:hypothetical protein